MEQKYYKLELITALLNSKSHTRELARKISKSHMLVVRKLRELKNENAVDYASEGRNKVYFLKKTIEAKAYAMMAEQYKLVNAVNKYPLLRNIISQIQRNEKIKIALLFGSYARGTAGKESDIDIYIDTDDSTIKKQLEPLSTKLNIKVGLYNESNLLIKEINKNYVIIKGAEEYYAKRKLLEQA